MSTLIPGALPRYYPDGLTPDVLDVLITESVTDALTGPHPTGTVLDGTARDRRDRREAHRALATLAAVVRSQSVAGEVAA
jgi:hypothetical protein